MPKRQWVDRGKRHKDFVSTPESSSDANINSSNSDNIERNGHAAQESRKCIHGRRGKGSVCRKCQSKLKYHETKPPNKKQMSVFPKRAVWVVFAATLLVRFNYISQQKNRWILHADEIYQTVEIAHSEVYGFGTRPYEYEQPPNGNFSTPLERFRADRGMYSLRSFLLPKLFMLVFTIAEFIGVNGQPFLVAKVFHALISSCLPISVYKITKVAYKSEDVAVMAAIFAAASLHLNVFGTHVLVNSFLAPFVFWHLANVLEILSKKEPNISHTRNDRNPKTVLLDIVNLSKIDYIHNNHNDKVDSFNRINVPTCDKTKPVSAKNGSKNSMDVIRTGCTLGVCVYVRPDLVLFLGVFLLPFAIRDFQPSFEYFLSLTKLAVSFISGMILAGMDDYMSYGQWGLSVYQWIRFNFLTDLSGTMFGTSSGTFYIEQTFLCNWACIVVSICTMVCVISQAVSASESGKENFKTNVILLLECFIILTIYSLQPHKESRFIHNVLVVLCIVQANAVVGFTEYHCRQSYADENYRQMVLYLIAALYVLVSWLGFPTEESWYFADSIIPSAFYECMSYISNQHDVTGIFSFIDTSVVCFSLFRQNVTVFTLMGKDFLEYSPDARIAVTSLNPWSLSSYNISINVANKISDIANTENFAYIQQVLVDDMRYNYAIIPYGTDLRSLGYEDVFKSTYYKIVKRSISQKSLKSAREFIKKTPVQMNSSILEYEGNKLIEHGVPLQAVSRLKQAIAMDKTRVQPYQLLMKVYSHVYLGDQEAFSKTWRQCVSLHGKELCLT